MKMKLNSLIAGITAVMMASTASAALVTYNFAGVKSGQNFGSYTDGALTVTGNKINGSSKGFGIKRNFLDSGEVDGAFNNDRITFDFGSGVTLTQINFRNFDSNDDFVLWADGSYQGSFDQDPFNTSIAGSVFKVGANGHFDNFRISSITVDSGAVVSASEPATLAMLGLGALAVGFARRKAS